jgi:TonB family protein
VYDPPVKNNIVAVAVFVSTWLVASHASALDIPELGVHIAQLPDASATPRVIRRLDGYQAIMPIGKATLTIARVDAPVPSSSDITAASFRIAQQAEFYEQPNPSAHEHASTVSGHDAWTIVSARSGGWHTVNYRCVTYTIVDQHLYRLVAGATGQDRIPPDFVAATRVMSELTLGPVERSSTPNEAAVGLLKMPAPRISNLDRYPETALRRGEQGVVDLEFSIDSKGHTREIHETYSDSNAFGAAAQELVRDTTYQVKPGWEESGYQKLRFPIEVQFSIAKGSSSCPREEAPPRIPEAEVWRVCSTLVHPKFP